MRPAGRSRAKLLAKLALAGVGIALLIAWQPLDDYAKVWRQIAVAPVLAAFSLLVPMIGLRIWQVRHLARLHGMDIAVGDLAKLQLAIAFYGLFLPGVLAAGALRWYRLARLGGNGPATLALVAFLRLLEIETTLALGLVFWIADARAPGGAALGVAAFGGLLLATSAARFAAFSPRVARRAAGMLERRWPPDRGRRWRGKVLELLESTRGYGRLAAGSWRGLLLAAVGQQLLGLLSLVLLAHAVGLDAGWATLGWARAFLMLAALLPVTWGGIGLRELTIAGALVAAGYPGAPAVTIGLLLSLRGLIEAALGGLIELRAWLARPRHQDAWS